MKDKIIFALLGGLLIYCITLTIFLFDVADRAGSAKNLSWYMYMNDFIELRKKSGEITMQQAVEETKKNIEKFQAGCYK